MMKGVRNWNFCLLLVLYVLINCGEGIKKAWSCVYVIYEWPPKYIGYYNYGDNCRNWLDDKINELEALRPGNIYSQRAKDLKNSCRIRWKIYINKEIILSTIYQYVFGSVHYYSFCAKFKIIKDFPFQHGCTYKVHCYLL